MTAHTAQEKTVLVVDDERDVLAIVTRILEHHRFQVLAASGPREALRLAAEYEGEIHLLLSDILMGDMHGPLLAAELSQLRPRMRVMFMTGYADGKLLLNQEWHCIMKPFMPAALLARVKRVLA